jgi:hypothetical protein
VVRFVRQHSVPGAAAAFPFLTPDLLDAGALLRDKSVLPVFDFVEKQPPGEKPI